MPFLAGELGVEKGVSKLARRFGPDNTGTQNQDIHIVVLNALVRGIHVVTETGANAGQFIRGDRSADAAAAYENAAIGLFGAENIVEFLRVIGVIDRLGSVGADVQDLVMQFAQIGHQLFLELNAGVIRSDNDSHEGLGIGRTAPDHYVAL